MEIRMKSNHAAYSQFVQWIQNDMRKDSALMNRKVFSVVLWCLILPTFTSLLLFGLRKFHLVETVRFADGIVFFPPFIFALYSLWPTLRNLPKVFRKGGIGTLLDESAREVEWRENTSDKLVTALKLTPKEWDLISFHLQSDLERMAYQNRYMTLLAGVVLFFMFQFLDLGSSGGVVYQAGPTGMIQAWVDQFSQWSIQVMSLVLFSTLFYLSGLQFQRYLTRYWVCVRYIVKQQAE
jgi:hypothetical protein